VAEVGQDDVEMLSGVDERIHERKDIRVMCIRLAQVSLVKLNREQEKRGIQGKWKWNKRKNQTKKNTDSNNLIT